MLDMNATISDIATRLTSRTKTSTPNQPHGHKPRTFDCAILAAAVTALMVTSPLSAIAATNVSDFRRLPNSIITSQDNLSIQNTNINNTNVNNNNTIQSIQSLSDTFIDEEKIDANNQSLQRELLAIIQTPIIEESTTNTTGLTDDAIEADTNLAKQFAENDSTNAGEAVAGNTDNIDTQSIDSITQSTPPATAYNQDINLNQYAKEVNRIQWYEGMKQNNAMTAKLQALLDWNHASPGPIDGGWGMNSVKALKNFQAIKGLEQTGRMNTATWHALTKNISPSEPVLKAYTITKEDVKTNFAVMPSGSEAKSKMKGLYYQDIYEMLAERFHMDVRYLKKLNTNKKFVEGDIITVYNPGKTLNRTITRVVANKADKTLYAYDGNTLVATYPTTVGSTATPSPHGTFKIVNKVKMPWYKSTVGDGADKQVYMLPPGPNSPVGVVWMGLNKPSYGIHGSPIPEGISRQASHGCIRLTNWDVLEVFANIQNGAKVELK